MLNPQNLDRVHERLDEVSTLASEFAEKRPDFPNRVQVWLEELETAAREAELPVVPKLASLRVGLEAAMRGLADPLQGTVRLTPRKARNAAAQVALRSAVDLTCNAVEPFEARRTWAEDIALKLASRSFEKRLWPGQSKDYGAPSDMPSMWRAMFADPELGTAVRELSIIVGVAPGMVLLARVMNEYAGGGQA